MEHPITFGAYLELEVGADSAEEGAGSNDDLDSEAFLLWARGIPAAD